MREYIEHKEHKFDNVIALYENRLSYKIYEDIKRQINEQKYTGKLSSETIEKLLETLDKDYPDIPVRSGCLYVDVDNKDEQKIIDTLNDTTLKVFSTYCKLREELMCQLDACDDYVQELTILYTYHILKSDGTIDDFKTEEKVEKNN